MATTSDFTSKSFSIANKNLKLNTKDDMAAILEDLSKQLDVEDVHFGGNTIGVEAALALSESLRKLKSLRIADFSDIFTGRLITEIPQALKSICDSLLECPALEEVNLSDNAFGGRSAEPMVNLLSNHPNLQVLKLNNNGLGIEGGKIVSGALKTLASHPQGSKLRVVICGRNRLENGSSESWAEAFSLHNKTLQAVKMPQNGIRPEGITAILTGLTSCAGLRELDLQDNTMTKNGSIAFSNAIKSWSSLEVINISDCLTGGRGGIEIAKTLATGVLKELKTLRIQFNEWDERALSPLSQYVSNYGHKLTTLEINGNRADPDEDVIENIREALSKHNHASALDELDEMEEYDPEDLEEESAGEESDVEDEGQSEVEKDTANTSPPVVQKETDLDDLTDQLAGTKIN
ncbi:hypothetical protein E3P99_03965 [Wallemia hederae]|uniref:Ran-GTPase activating protein 1 C-terminal domain-containing protein n=1 Tax=Wallemia hederae TaxID=1540922 RepID=A0A4V4LSH3_9BASI|nr:hypothetical protein E3P99_03965 [Wallemia hederae]